MLFIIIILRAVALNIVLSCSHCMTACDFFGKEFPRTLYLVRVKVTVGVAVRVSKLLGSNCNRNPNHSFTLTLNLPWEGLAADRTEWRSALKQHLETGEEKLMAAAADKLARRKEGSSSIRPKTTHRCDVCNKDCHSRIGLFSHKRRCSNTARN